MPSFYDFREELQLGFEVWKRPIRNVVVAATSNHDCVMSGQVGERRGTGQKVVRTDLIVFEGGVRRYSTISGTIPFSSRSASVARDLEQRGL